MIDLLATTGLGSSIMLATGLGVILWNLARGKR